MHSQPRGKNKSIQYIIYLQGSHLGVDVGLLEDDAHGGARGGVDAGEGRVLGVVPLHVLGVVLEDARGDGVPDALGGG